MIVVHHCQECGHFAQEHESNLCSYGYCKCTRARMVRGPSEVVTTYEANDGAHPEVMACTPPGSRWLGGGPPTELCRCQECWELAQRVGVA